MTAGIDSAYKPNQQLFAQLFVSQKNTPLFIANLDKLR